MWTPLLPPSHPFPCSPGHPRHVLPAGPTDSHGKSQAKGSGAALALKIAFARLCYARIAFAIVESPLGVYTVHFEKLPE